MKIYKHAVLIKKDSEYLEVISYYNSFSKTFGLDFFLKNRLIEAMDFLENEPTRDEMRFFGQKLDITTSGDELRKKVNKSETNTSVNNN